MHFLRVAVGARDHEFVRDAELLELGRATLHNRKVGLGPHDDANQRSALLLCHNSSKLLNMTDRFGQRPMVSAVL